METEVTPSEGTPEPIEIQEPEETNNATHQEDGKEEKPRQRPYERQRYKAYRHEPKDEKEDEDPKKSADDMDKSDVRKLLGKEEGKESKDDEKDAQKPKEEADDDGKEESKSKKVKITVDGKEAEADLEKLLPGLTEVFEKASDETKEKFIRAVQKSVAADKRIEEHSILLKKTNKLANDLVEDPGKVIRKIDKFKEPEAYKEWLENELYNNFIRLEQMDPKDREIEELKGKLKTKEDLEEEQKRIDSQKEEEALKKQFSTDISKGIMESIDENDLPKSDYVVSLYAKYLKMALSHKDKNGHPIRLKPHQVADLVKEDVQKMFKHMFSSSDGNRLIKFFGEDVADKISKAKIDNLKKPEEPTVTEPKKGGTPTKQKKPRSFSDGWRTRFSS